MGEVKQFIIIVVSPLDYIRQQQVANVAKTMCRVRAAVIGESEENDKEISEGKYNIVYSSVEQWLNHQWKNFLQHGGLHKSKILVVDEVHTVEKWYDHDTRVFVTTCICHCKHDHNIILTIVQFFLYFPVNLLYLYYFKSTIDSYNLMKSLIKLIKFIYLCH